MSSIVTSSALVRAFRGPPAAGARDRSAIHRIVLGLVWLTVASGAIVFTEPAPVDMLTMGLVVLLPVVGLVSIRPVLLVYLAIWTLAGVGALLASAQSYEIDRSTTHSLISIYLYVASFVLAAFVAKSPLAHTRLILRAYLWAASVAAAAGIVGYFDLVPGAAELFTLNMRATGTFKDPNVYGPFLVPATVLALHRTVTRRFAGSIASGLMLVVLSFAVLLSFSRGAWLNLAIAVAIYGYVQLVTAATDRQRLKLLTLAIVGLVAMLGLVAAALQSDSIGRLLEERAALTQSYDEGPEGRFGGHEKAKDLVIDNPLGIGATQFSGRHHHEDVHNVYLAMFLNAGWAGGLVFILMMAGTALAGLRHAFRRTATQPLFVVALASFIGIAVEGAVIDVDHWRHLYLLMGILWGLMAADRRIVGAGSAHLAGLARAFPWQTTRPRRAPRIVGRPILLPERTGRSPRRGSAAARRPRIVAGNVVSLSVYRLDTGRRHRGTRRPPRIIRPVWH